MKLKKILAICMIAALTVTSFAGCGKQNDNADNSKPNTEANSNTQSDNKTEDKTDSSSLDEVQELNLTFTDLKTLDVNDVRNANEFQVLSQIHEGLFRTLTDENGNEVVQNAGCESYEVSEDGTVYTFHLREQKWSDGQKVTAQQYVDSFKRLLDPELAFAYSFMAYDIKGAGDYYDNGGSADNIGVKALDENTLEITLEANIPFFIKKLSNVCFFPIRLDIIEAGGESYANDFTKHVFNGPFVIESRILENEMVLVKNPNYWDAENVKLNKVTFKVVAEQATQSLLIDSKELDAVVATTEYISKWEKMTDNGQLVHISQNAPSVNYMCFNQHTGGPSGLMNNAKVRLALSLALDREEFNELVYDGINTPAYGLIPSGIMVGEQAYSELNPEPLKALCDEYTNDADKLQAMFKEGMSEAGVSGELSDVNLIFITTGQTAQAKAQQEFFKQQWESKLGITVNMNVLADSSLFVTERNANRYDLVYMGWNGDYNDPMTFMELWNTGSGYAKYMGGYHNDEFDKMFDSLATESDNTVRAKTYVDMENNLVVENAGMSPLNYTNNQFFIQSYVKNLSTPMFGTQYDFSRAYISGK